MAYVIIFASADYNAIAVVKPNGGIIEHPKTKFYLRNDYDHTGEYRGKFTEVKFREVKTLFINYRDYIGDGVVPNNAFNSFREIKKWTREKEGVTQEHLELERIAVVLEIASKYVGEVINNERDFTEIFFRIDEYFPDEGVKNQFYSELEEAAKM